MRRQHAGVALLCGSTRAAVIDLQDVRELADERAAPAEVGWVDENSSNTVRWSGSSPGVEAAGRPAS
jgi:hypothetical protein